MVMENLWDQRYATDTYIYGTEPNDWFVEKLKILKPGKLLLPGEGEGRNAVWASDQGWDVTAFDQSYEAKAKAMKLAAEKQVPLEYHVKDLRCFRGEEAQYDAIGLIYVHMPPDYRQKVHHEFVKMLKPGGCLIFQAFSKAQLPNKSGGPKDLELLYNEEELRSDFKELRLLEFHNVRLHIEEGTHHKGVAEILRLFARK
jgi:SAM-dependent methyltransferase